MHTEIRELARRFSQETLAPLVEADERESRFRPELIRQLGELGLTGIPVPERDGGAGLGYREYIVVVEELAAINLGYAISLGVTGLTQMILCQFGNEEQRKKYIPRLAQGQAIGAFSLSEASSGSDAGSLRTTARKVGNEYILSGTKLWCTQADVAETIIVMARTGGPGPGGVSSFIVEGGMKGLQFGKCEKKMGMNTSHTMELILDEVHVPESHLIGNEGDGFKISMSALHNGRITIGASALGLARAALDVALTHARGREQFGNPIGEFQGISFMLADMATEYEAARLLVERAAQSRDNGEDFAIHSSMAKRFSTDMAMRVTTDAVQILGGNGYTQEFQVERFMREAKVLQIVEGTNQIQRLIIGRHLLKKGLLS